MTHVSDEMLGKIARQQHDLFRRVREGTLDPTMVSRAIQDVIDGKFTPMTWNPPTWWRTPEQQLKRARQLWPNDVLPEPPGEFIPRTKSEVLLLHVSDTFDSLWNNVVVPMKDGTIYTKYRWESVKADELNLRLAPNKHKFAQPVWLAFDPERGKGERPDSFWGLADCAASEVFSALIQFPEWSLAWFHGASAPNLSGYQLKHEGNWSHVPSLSRWDDERELELCDRWADDRFDRRSSPSVREC